MKYILASLIISVSVFAQGINKLDESGNKQGVWKGIYQESKRTRYEGTFEHGKEIGLFKFFDDTKAGTIIATREFNNKDNSCYTIFYNQNKNKVSEGKVVNKQFEGDWIYYHEDSPLVMTFEHYANGKLNGIRKVFYKSEKIAEEAMYIDGIKNGTYKKYAENGILLEETIYKDGEYEGLAIFRDVDNKIYAQGLFRKGKKVGIWKILEKGKVKNVNFNFQGEKFQKRVKPVEQK